MQLSQNRHQPNSIMGWRERVIKYKLKKWFFKQSLPLGFLLAIIVSMSWPAPGEAVAHWQVNGWKVATTTNMAVIFFIFGLTTDTSELLLALKAWRAIAFGLASILVLSPLFGFLCMLLPFKPYEFALGLAVMACVPTSLSSGVTLVIGAHGNGALALLFTVSANILGIMTAPLAVKAVLGSRLPNAHVDSLDLLFKLGVSILMPVLVGKGLREAVAPLRRTIPRFKAPLYLINNLQITMIVWQKLSSARSVLVEQEAGDVLLAGFAAVVLHFVFLLFNMVATWLLRFPEKERKAIIVMASQKSLPTAAVIISYFDPRSVGNPGLMTIPCIVFYIMQLFIDSFIANTWASKYERFAALQQAFEAQMQEEAQGDSPHQAVGGQQQLSSKVAAKLLAPDSTAGEQQLIGMGVQGAVVAGGAARPSRGALLNRRQSSTSDSEEALGLMQTVELNEANPLAERPVQQQQQWRVSHGGEHQQRPY